VRTSHVSFQSVLLWQCRLLLLLLLLLRRDCWCKGKSGKEIGWQHPGHVGRPLALAADEGGRGRERGSCGITNNAQYQQVAMKHELLFAANVIVQNRIACYKFQKVCAKVHKNPVRIWPELVHTVTVSCLKQSIHFSDYSAPFARRRWNFEFQEYQGD
jgi:hypothetical protein